MTLLRYYNLLYGFWRCNEPLVNSRYRDCLRLHSDRANLQREPGYRNGMGWIRICTDRLMETSELGERYVAIRVGRQVISEASSGVR
jgi:hypothetical protein